MIETRSLGKCYGKRQILEDVTLSIPTGSFCLVLGQNGSGKSTLLRLLAGVTEPTSGAVFLDRRPMTVATKQTVAWCPDVDPFAPEMTIDELLAFLAPFFPGWREEKCQSLLSLLGLERERSIAELSEGEKARLKLVIVFARPSKLVLLDDPFKGIDRESRKIILDTLFDEFPGEGQTLVVSTHLIKEIEHLADEVILLGGGRLLLHEQAEKIRSERGLSLTELYDEMI
ncbi:ABC transporter ATP-binding protein [Sulfidibacter corallicola]|uniref:ABC transporter ATP-binding protein n=1 Tax=Sulfidibacter corallicola TaxID=2818388 RepID=A0A8A4TQH1_SULCO|nr:ABC transporter ATP-binding protein [Sulfidibacter corallicola]QTD48795.1 ABC transporter ATP-binding protein [Sulfidibacter corallicola]